MRILPWFCAVVVLATFLVSSAFLSGHLVLRADEPCVSFSVLRGCPEGNPSSGPCDQWRQQQCGGKVSWTRYINYWQCEFMSGVNTRCVPETLPGSSTIVLQKVCADKFQCHWDSTLNRCSGVLVDTIWRDVYKTVPCP